MRSLVCVRQALTRYDARGSAMVIPRVTGFTRRSPFFAQTPLVRLSSFAEDRLAKQLSENAVLQAKLARSEAQLTDNRAQLSASKAQLAASNDALLRSDLQRSLTSLVFRARDVDSEHAMGTSIQGTPWTGAPKWTYDPLLFGALRASQDPSGAVSASIADAVMYAGCTPAQPGSSERPSNRCPLPNDVHSHVRPVVDAVVGVLVNSPTLQGWDDVLHPRRIKALYEQSYNNQPALHIPDHSAVFTHGSYAQLTAETQGCIIDAKIPAILKSQSPCEGERQVAGYVAHSLVPPIACGVPLDGLSAHPMSAFGVYTDSISATLIEVRVGDTVSVIRSRMPFLPGHFTPVGTACLDRDPAACGAVAFGLGIMASLRNSRLRATGSIADIRGISPQPAGLILPHDAEFLGRGRFARVYSCGGFAVKVPLSRLDSAKQWSDAINAEADALLKLASRPPPCLHFPRLAVPVTAAADPTAPSGARYAGMSTIEFNVRALGAAAATTLRTASVASSVQGLVTGPVLTMLPQAINELRSLLPLAERSIPVLVTFVLAVALPLLSAQAHARSCRLTHGDAHSMNVGLNGWDASAATSFLRALPVRAPFTLAGTEDSAGASRGALRVVAMCRSVVLNDWGCAKPCGVAGMSVPHAVAQDTAQVVALVSSMLQLLLDGLTTDELRDSFADDDAVQWSAGASERCLNIISELAGETATLAAGDTPRQRVLQALGLACPEQLAGLANNAVDPAPLAYSSARADAFCVTALAATGCACYDAASGARHTHTNAERGNETH